MSTFVRMTGLMAAAVAALVSGRSADAAIVPYTGTEPGTVALWHFNESAGSGTAVDASGNGRDLTVTGTGAAISVPAPSLPGFGNTFSTTGDTGGIARHNNVAVADLVGANGEFSVDMLVKINDQTGFKYLFTLEKDGTNSTNRVLHVWYYKSGDTYVVELENVGGSTVPFELPDDGPNAVNYDDWFHLGITYSGDTDATTNLTVYWTKADPSNTEANLLGTGKWTGDLKDANATDIGVGNSSRNTGTTASFNGLIDEVRFSNVVRDKDSFIFQVPEPSSYILVAIGASVMGMLRMKRRK